MSWIYEFGWYAVIVAVVGEFIVPMVLSVFYKDYHQAKESISVLGNPDSPVRIPFNIWMLTAGILLIFSLPSVFIKYAPVSTVLSIMLIIFIGVFAVGACIFSCFFSVNKSKETVTTASKIHGVGSVIGFMLMLFVPLIVAILSYRSLDNIMGNISILSFILAMLFFVLFVMSDKPSFADTAIAQEGLWQRLNLLFMYLPIFIVAVKQIIIK